MTTRNYMKMLPLVVLMALATAAEAKGYTSAPVRKQLLNDGWQFCLNDSDFTQAEAVTLPHDWSIHQRFDRQAPAGNDGAYLPTGRGWYRRELVLDEGGLDKLVRLYFEGVYMNSQVYVNGQLAGGWPYGYSSFWVNATPYLRAGRNEVVVSVDNSRQKNCRWYSGSGIYRNVWLLTTDKVHFREWGSRVEQTGGLKLTVEVQNEDTQDRTVTVFGHTETIAPGGVCPFTQIIDTTALRRWSPEDPVLNKVRAKVVEDGRVIDTEEVTYGWRTVEWDAQQGLRLNGKALKLNGACLHHDNGILGAAAYDAAEYRKARLMKEAGFNAVRTSHNPPSEAFLRACDELGLLVIDEAFDGWREKKNDHDYHELIGQWWQRDLQAMVERDRCHPSIFCWSIGNEVIERKHIGIIQTAHRMAEHVRQLDPERRPVTSALAAWDNDWDIYDPLAAEHDIVGYNYMMHKAESDHQRVPSRVMMQTESYPRDAWQNYARTQQHSYIIGDFVWTGLDYLGESGIGRWYYEGDPAGEHWERPLYPWHAAYCGDVDLTGLRKPISHYRSMLWNADEELYMAVLEPNGWRGEVRTTMWGTWPTFESWNWPGWEGKEIKVEVCSRRSPVRLYLNGQLVGEQATKEQKAIFSLPYAPGTLRAEAAGQEVSLTTAGVPAALRLTADRTQLKADGQDLAFITAEVVDAQGRVVPTADNELTFKVEGATLVAAGNADIKDEAPYSDNRHRAWKGRALCVVRTAQKAGRIRLTVSSPGLPARSISLRSGK